jgi:thioredoxin-related protein
MKKICILIFAIGLFAGYQSLNAQETKKPVQIYNPQADAKQEIDQAIAKAKAENKHVFIQVGGNWCGWCIKFHAFIKEDPEIRKMVEDNYVFTLLNYSTENKNKEILTQYRNPGRLGFPVFLILDGNGQLIHTQDSGLLEEGNGYNKAKVINFFNKWTYKALDPTSFR